MNNRTQGLSGDSAHTILVVHSWGSWINQTQYSPSPLCAVVAPVWAHRTLLPLCPLFICRPLTTVSRLVITIWLLTCSSDPHTCLFFQLQGQNVHLLPQYILATDTLWGGGYNVVNVWAFVPIQGLLNHCTHFASDVSYRWQYSVFFFFFDNVQLWCDVLIWATEGDRAEQSWRECSFSKLNSVRWRNGFSLLTEYVLC